jgi:hypothetical protein
MKMGVQSLTAAAVFSALAAAAWAQAPGCVMALAAIRAPHPRFEAYPAPAQRAMRPAPVVLASKPARAFRTQLREAAAKGPNFAGHYTIATWGCGAGCEDWAIIDAATGWVTFPEGLRDLSVANVGEEPGAPDESFEGLRYRKTSRLIAVLGAPREDAAREGVGFYLWDGQRLSRVAFVPRKAACAPAH